jgi:hypothetical protein
MHSELPARPDLGFYRKEAKSLVRDYRAGAAAPVARVEAVLGERARQRFLLSDAQYVIAAEHGHRSWGDFRRFVESAPPRTPVGESAREIVRAALAEARASWGETGEVTLETGATYGDGEQVRIRVRKRDRRYDIDDLGRAVKKAGRPPRWLARAQRVVAQEGFNVNRAGVVFVPAFEGRDLASLALRLADCCLAVYGELLELDDEGA